MKRARLKSLLMRLIEESTEEYMEPDLDTAHRDVDAFLDGKTSWWFSQTGGLVASILSQGEEFVKVEALNPHTHEDNTPKHSNYDLFYKERNTND